jgi:hypothetical protein
MSEALLDLFLINQIDHSLTNHDIISQAVIENEKDEKRRAKSRKSSWVNEEISDDIFINLDNFLVSSEYFINAFNKLKDSYNDQSIIISKLLFNNEIYGNKKDWFVPNDFLGLVGNRRFYIHSTNLTYKKKNEKSFGFYINVFEDASFATAWKIMK